MIVGERGADVRQIAVAIVANRNAVDRGGGPVAEIDVGVLAADRERRAAEVDVRVQSGERQGSVERRELNLLDDDLDRTRGVADRAGGDQHEAAVGFDGRRSIERRQARDDGVRGDRRVATEAVVTDEDGVTARRRREARQGAVLGRAGSHDTGGA